MRKGFTLIELLVVIAIIAILAVVVVLTLNPAQLLAQSRDSSRVSDLSTINDAINLYNTDQGGASGYSLGNASSIYVSVPDSSSTCGDLGLPTLPSGTGYACSSSSNYRNASSSGWLPVNFQNISAGSPLGNLPVDPTNQTSSGLYYTYTTTGSQYTLMALMESQKYKNSVTGGLGNGIDVVGSNVGVGPAGWWMLNEGTGTVAYDTSGNDNNGTWIGTKAGTSGYYSPGNVGPWAGYFDGSTDYVSMGSTTIMATSSFTLSYWVYPTSLPSSVARMHLAATIGGTEWFEMRSWQAGSQFIIATSGGYWGLTPGINFSLNTWQYVAVVCNFSTNQAIFYFDGTVTGTSTLSGWSPGAMTYLTIGSDGIWMQGEIDDVRIYNRVLSPQEIETIYNAKN